MTGSVEDEKSGSTRISLQDFAASGQAALLLTESLIHSLISSSVITVADAVDIVEIAADSGQEILDNKEGSQPIIKKAIDLLEAIRASLMYDLPEKAG